MADRDQEAVADSACGSRGKRSGPSSASRERRSPLGLRSRLLNRSGDLLAALDLGTNNCRLLIARRSGASFDVVDAFSRIVRLGEGVSLHGRLSDAAMARAMEALHLCAAKIRRWGLRPEQWRGVATEACRQAENGSAFLARVTKETGLVVETISSQEEARLALAGCSPLLDPAQPGALVFDIGGGSTELTWLSLKPGRPPKIRGWTSIPLGVVTLTERYGGDRIGPTIYRDMIEDVRESLHSFEERHRINEAIRQKRVQMLGTSGTVTTLAGLHLDLPRYKRAKVDGTFLQFPHVDAVSQRLIGLDFRGRAALPCIGEDRADLVVSGCAILEAICQTWPVGSLRVADRGVREGILMSMIGHPRGQVLPTLPDPSGEGPEGTGRAPKGRDKKARKGQKGHKHRPKDSSREQGTAQAQTPPQAQVKPKASPKSSPAGAKACALSSGSPAQAQARAREVLGT